MTVAYEADFAAKESVNFGIICVTNCTLCSGDFLTHMEKIAKAGPAGIILREKDLPEPAYRELATWVLEICRRNHVPCILHNFVWTAIELEADAIHLPLPILRNLSSQDRARFRVLGASCHSIEDALEAERLGCTYITAGHIFATDCKRGVPPRGTEFLKAVCESVKLPVYAIGGIGAGNISLVKEAGARGACVMSGLMRSEDVAEYMRSLF